jgi:secondary thiamine-phosphate synthase enzyme
MEWFKETLEIQTAGKGLKDFTAAVRQLVSKWGINEGICFLYIPHTSASLVVSENYDPTAKRDLETFMEILVLENQSWHEHDLEGADDSPAHIRAMITSTSLSIPIDHGELSLGRWQGIYLFEHRKQRQWRSVLVRGLKAL